jgi:protein phosphatase methylesterase 1
MGGALAVHAALTGTIDGLIGLVVVDVVEGTAMDALSSMQNFLRGRPKHFPSIENAVEWSLRSGQVRNTDSARISMPGQLKNAQNGSCAALEVTEKESTVITYYT